MRSLMAMLAVLRCRKALRINELARIRLHVRRQKGLIRPKFVVVSLRRLLVVSFACIVRCVLFRPSMDSIRNTERDQCQNSNDASLHDTKTSWSGFSHRLAQTDNF